MKSYNQALNEIYSKADEQINKIRQRKQKRKKMLATVVPVCFLMVICLSIGFGMWSETQSPVDISGSNMSPDNIHHGNGGSNIIENPPFIDNNQHNDDVISGGENTMIPSIYPNAWKQMNAVIVKWKEQNEHTWTETYKQYDGKDAIIDYVGVEVEFVTVYSETMKESLIPNIESIIDQSTYLMIPKCYLDDIKSGDTALVFLDKIADVAIQDANGNFEGMFTTILGVRLGDNIAQSKYVPASIFNIVEDKLVISENFYEVNPDNDEYYMIVMTHLHKANEYIRKNDSMKSIVFENGVNVVDLGAYFEFICGNK